MGTVLTHSLQAGRTPNCIGAYELVHTNSQRRLIGMATDLAYAKRHHLAKLAAGLHENLELQEAFGEDTLLDFVSYPAANRQQAEQLLEELRLELQPAGRLFEPSSRVMRLKLPGAHERHD